MRPKNWLFCRRLIALLLLSSPLAACSNLAAEVPVLATYLPVGLFQEVTDAPTGTATGSFVLPDSPTSTQSSGSPTNPEDMEKTIQTGLCNRAAAGSPLDLTIPDGSRMRPGESFTKTWRLVNNGDCVWTRDYVVIYFSGERFNTTRSYRLSANVEPGDSIDLSLDMTAPQQPGSYQGNFKLMDTTGNLFGLGPNGNSPIWVKIEVVGSATSTATQMPASTPTPVIYQRGEVIVKLNGSVDLDKSDGLDSDDGEKDMALSLVERLLALMPLNNAKLAIYGMNQPDISDCQTLDLSDSAVILEELETGMFLCYRTSRGLPGYLRLINSNLPERSVSVLYVTWSIP